MIPKMPLLTYFRDCRWRCKQVCIFDSSKTRSSFIDSFIQLKIHSQQQQTNLGVDVGEDEEIAVGEEVDEGVPIVPAANLVRTLLQQRQRDGLGGGPRVKLVAGLERTSHKNDVPRRQDLRSGVPALHEQIVRLLDPIIFAPRPNEADGVVALLVPTRLHKRPIG